MEKGDDCFGGEVEAFGDGKEEESVWGKESVKKRTGQLV